MKLYCTTCSQVLGGPAELCHHRNPVGLCCCYAEHRDPFDAPEDDAG